VNRCSICKILIPSSDVPSVCAECNSAYHQVCWEQLGGCATYGCTAAAIPEKPSLPTSVARGWGDEKTCPQCGDKIPSSLIRCLCGAYFPWADPMTAEEYQTWLSEDKGRTRMCKQMVILFLLTILGLPAPITGGFAGIQAYRYRTLLVGEVGTYLALGYGAGVIGMVYSLIFVLLYFHW
jgi:hypothetical protein